MVLFSEPAPPQRSVALEVEDPALHDLLTALLRHWRVDPLPREESRLVLQLAPDGEKLALVLDNREVEDLALPVPLETLWLALQEQLFEPPRLHYRIPVRLRAQLYQHGREEPFLSVSLSDAGIRFELYRELVRDEEVAIELPLPDGALRLAGKVIYCVPARNSGRMIVGVMFRGHSPEAGARLRAFLVESTLTLVREQLERDRFLRALGALELPPAVRARLGG